MFRLDSSTVAQLVPPRGKTTQLHRLVCSTVSANHRVVVLWLISSIISTPKRVYKRETNNPRSITRYVMWQDHDEKQNSYILFNKKQTIPFDQERLASTSQSSSRRGERVVIS